MRLDFSPNLFIDSREIELRFIQSSGPGGQNVNKLASAAQLRFDMLGSPSLPEAVKQRVRALAGRRLTSEGAIVITARRFRSQEQNRQDAIDRLLDLLRRAAAPRTPRRPTKPSGAEKRARLAAKSRRSTLKSLRRRIPEE